MKIYAFGEVLWDIYPDKKALGGAPLNFGAHLSRFGEEVYMLSAVGNDDLGKETLEAIESLGVKTDFVSVLDDKETGKCLVTLDEKAVPRYNLLSDVSYDYITPEIKTGADVLYFGTLALRSENNFNSLSALLGKYNFGEVFVDVNIRPPHYSEKTVLFAIKNATILKISDEELETVAELISSTPETLINDLKKLSSKLKVIIITKGGKGAEAYNLKTNKKISVAAEKAEVVSTVGAGDSFSAAFLSSFLYNEDLEKALKKASRLASIVVSNLEAIPEYNPQELN
jgi:fructokinase